MKTLLTLFVLLFSSSVLADDISDFEIEGMSVRDSLLEYMTEEAILKEFEIGKNDYHWTDKKFANVFIYEGIKNYEYLSATVKKNDKKYIIYGLRGMNDYEDINICFKKQKEIVNNLAQIFKNTKQSKEKFQSSADTSGESMIYAKYFIFNSGDEVEVTCYEFSKNVNYPDGIDVGILTKELVRWLEKFAKYEKIN